MEKFEISSDDKNKGSRLKIHPRVMAISIFGSLLLLLGWISSSSSSSSSERIVETPVSVDGTSSKPIDTVSSAIVTNGGSYKLISTHSHDINSFTQGLVFSSHDESLVIESAGLYGKSDVRIVNYDTGEVVKKTAIDGKYFAEGVHLSEDGVLYMLTWKERTCLAFDGATLEKREDLSFKYQTHTGEGWGITGDGEGNLYVRWVRGDEPPASPEDQCSTSDKAHPSSPPPSPQRWQQFHLRVGFRHKDRAPAHGSSHVPRKTRPFPQRA